MLSVKGKFQNGVAQPYEPVAGKEGQEVVITFLEQVPSSPAMDESWDTLTKMIERCTVDTGIEDLADQHDHYLYGKPKHD
jgi:predicted DNA-binding antitoxin AbrB/MazE fold protein